MNKVYLVYCDRSTDEMGILPLPDNQVVERGSMVCRFYVNQKIAFCAVEGGENVHLKIHKSFNADCAWIMCGRFYVRACANIETAKKCFDSYFNMRFSVDPTVSKLLGIAA